MFDWFHVTTYLRYDLVFIFMVQSFLAGIFWMCVDEPGWKGLILKILSAILISAFGFLGILIFCIALLGKSIWKIKVIQNSVFIIKHIWLKIPLPRYTKYQYQVLSKVQERFLISVKWWHWGDRMFLHAVRYIFKNKPSEELIPEYYED